MPVTPFSTQTYQWGQETSPGNGGNATKNIRSQIWTPKEDVNLLAMQAAGRRFTQTTGVQQIWTSFKFDTKEATFQEILWIIEAMWGSVAPSSLGTKTKKRVYTPALTGALSPKTGILQWGDANNVNAHSYVLPYEFTLKTTRKDGVSYSGSAYAQELATGQTFTATPGNLEQIPMTGQMLQYFLDLTSAAIGGTQQLTSIFGVQFDLKNLFGLFWDSDRNQPSWAVHVDAQPTVQIKLDIVENAGTRAIVANLKAGGIYFLRIDVQAPANSIETGQAYTFQWDYAVRLAPGDSISAWGDTEAVLGRTITLEIVEDMTWQKAMVINSVTAEAALV